jgi:branched-chain amino acid transport system permease protein
MKKLSFLLFICLFLMIPYFAGPYFVYLVNMMLVYSVISVGLNILYGNTGQISLGHGAFVGIGAYTTAILLQHCPWMPYPFVLLIVALVSVCVGILLAVPSFRLTGYYLALATMAFSSFVEQVLIRWKSLTKGPAGFNIPAIRIFDLKFDSDAKLFYLFALIAGALILAARNLLRTKTGRILTAIRDNEVAAQILGIWPIKYKTIAFSLSAVYAGVGGGLYAALVRFLYPTTFGLNMSIFFLIAVIVGGRATIVGSISGAVLLTVLPEALSETRHLLLVVEGIVLVLVVIFMPQGVVGFFNGISKRFLPRGWRKTEG